MQVRRLTSVLLVIAVWATGCSDGTEIPTEATNTTTAVSVDAEAGDGATTVEDDTATTVGADRWPTALASLDPDDPARWTVEVLDRFPHDTGAFTQGLERLEDGMLLESTGIRGESTIRRVDPATGDVVASAPLRDTEFGEGATVVDDIVVQLTWQSEVARRWALPTLEPLDDWRYDGEGWGLCVLGDRFAMSDGTSTLRFRTLDTFAVLDEVTVTFDGNEVTRLNELECVDGHVVANIWQSPTVVVIRPDGRAVASIDGTPLVDEIGSEAPGREVLNGIAVRDGESLWMTGKLWPTLFAVRVVPVA